ncbi:hypothetical protein BDY19DRAFT_82900 [Irpex rosettiformis]|uniref:Uncharacterized protein n=1 Tax=Irpex rosettiformis TaxID=378272 RepID=A0ACB8U6F2_9APHY|nr:hypothetical protein BDY19DRAFT_82900 [Irpex rosettiformis]
MFRWKLPTSLPTPAAVQIPNMNTTIQPTVMSAYGLCHDEEQRLLKTQNQRNDQPLIHIRILGWMFVYNLGTQMLIKLSEAVTSCRGVDATYDWLGEFYLNYWIRPFRIRGRTPDSSRTSRSSLEADSEVVDLAALLKAPQVDHSGAKALALERDGYCCVLTGIVDCNSVRDPWVGAMYKKEKKSWMYTECAHIFSKSTDERLDDESKKLYAGRAWAVLESFGYGDMLGEVDGSDGHCRENILTLETNCHHAFDELRLWLEPIEPDNPDSHSYHIRTHYYSHPSLPASVTFTDHARPEYRGQIPLPSKRYLRVHAACCSVAAMSGAREYLDKVMRDQESIDVLSTDGGSPDVAVNAVWKAFYSISE